MTTHRTDPRASDPPEDPFAACHERPAEPDKEGDVWYRGWECGFDGMAHDYSGEGWRAYKGGCDLDAKQVSAKTWDALLDEIDDAEDE